VSICCDLFAQGGKAIPYPKRGFWAFSATLANVTSLRSFEKPGQIDPPAEDPPLFLACASNVCLGGQNFSCAAGYRGILCQQCEPDRFLNSLSSCDVRCDDIEPRGVVTVLGILCVILCWLVMNKMTAGQ
jgi:hypothetical protein